MPIGRGTNFEIVSGANSNPITLPVDPAVAPRGALVFIAYGGQSTDLVTGVTYGGVAMTRRVTVADTTGAVGSEQVGRSYIYVLEGGVPSGARNVVVTRTGTEIIWVACWTLTGNEDMEVIASASTSSVADPAVTLNRAGRSCLGFLVLYTAQDAPASTDGPVGWSRGPDHAFADRSAMVFYEQAVSSADATYTLDHPGANTALCGIVVTEEAAAPPPTGASDHCCGAECGITDPDINGAAIGHWHTAAGPCVSQTGIARYGGRALRFTANNEMAYRGRLISGTQRWERVYIRYETLPDRNVGVINVRAVAGNNLNVLYRSATQDLIAALGAQVGTVGTPHPIVAGKWYRVECLADVSANPRTMKMRICSATDADPFADGASIDRGTASFAEAASTLVELRIGAACAQNVVADAIFDDHLTGAMASGYPAGPSSVVPASPVSDGTHNYNAAGDFRSASGDLGLGSTTAWQRLSGLLVDASSLLQAASAAAGEYLEIMAGGATSMTSIRAIEVVSVHKGATLSAHKQTLRWMSGASSVDVFTDADFSEDSLIQHSKHYHTMPGGATPTTALINASKWRFASSFTSVLTGGQIAGLIMEVDGVLTAPPPPPPGSSERNPTHAFASAGTYPVTLTVRDDDGFTHAVTQMVTVPAGVTSVVSRTGTDTAKAGDTATASVAGAAATNSLLTLEVREAGTVRAIRYLEPVDPVAGQSTRYELLLTAAERATVTNWNSIEVWLIAHGGTKAIRVTRFRILPP